MPSGGAHGGRRDAYLSPKTVPRCHIFRSFEMEFEVDHFQIDFEASMSRWIGGYIN